VTVAIVIYQQVCSLCKILNKHFNEYYLEIIMRFPTLVFDIETLTDLKAGAHLYHLICLMMIWNRR
jgi:hypothetical protein